MFESFKNHPLSQDVKKAKDAIVDFNKDTAVELSHSVGNWSTKILDGLKWIGDKIYDRFGPVVEEPTPEEPKVDRTDWV